MRRSRHKVPPIQNLKFVVADEMRYDTVGDYSDDGTITVYSGLNKIERIAVGLHEAVEFYLLQLQGVTSKMVDQWDTEDTGGHFDKKMYEKDIRYDKADFIALCVEQAIIEVAGMNWKKYEQKILSKKVKWNKKKWQASVAKRGLRKLRAFRS